MEFLRRSLRARLLTLFILVAIVPLAVTGYLAYESGRQSIVKDVESHLHSVATLKEQEIESWVDHLEHTIVWLATSPQVSSDATILATHNTDDPRYLAAHQSLVAEFRRIAVLRHLSSIFLLDSTSGQVIAAPDTTWEGKFRESEPYFTQGKNNIYVSEIFHSLTLGQPTMVISTPVEDNTGQLVGVLAGHARLAQLSEIMLERGGMGQTGETYLVNKNNLLLTESRFEPGLAFRKWVFTEGVSRTLKGESGTSLYLDYRGKPVIGAYRWMEGKPTDYPTELVVGEEAEVVLTVANHEYRTTSYEIVIEIDGIKNARIGPITIDHGEEWQQRVSFTPREMGEEVPVEFLLYRQGHEDSYKSLRLWVDIVG